MLIPRKPDIDLDQAAIIWSRVPEFSLFFNGTSAAIPCVEYFLINVMGEVLKTGVADEPELARELELFIKQEANHSAYHNRYNKRMYDAGFGALRPVLSDITEDFRAMRATRSLEFCAAYCAGFEDAATASAQYLLEGCADLFEGAEPNGANLLLWHVAEEFEHRALCHDAFMAVSGSYFMRIWGLLYALWHINVCFARCRNVILKAYRKEMSASERRASAKRHCRILIRQAWHLFPRTLRLFSPFYHPGRLPVTSGVQRALDLFAGQSPVMRTPYAESGS